MIRRPPRSTLLSLHDALPIWLLAATVVGLVVTAKLGGNAMNWHLLLGHADRKSTRLNSSHSQISYAVFCLKKKKKTQENTQILKPRNRQKEAVTHHNSTNVV